MMLFLGASVGYLDSRLQRLVWITRHISGVGLVSRHGDTQ